MISRDNVQAIYPLQKKQRGLAFYSLQHESADPGFIQIRFVIKGPLEQDVFNDSWQELTAAHESMRLTLQSPENKPSMLVALKSCQLPVEWADKRSDPPEVQQDYIDQRLIQLRQQGLDLSSPPVHKLLAVQTDEHIVEFFWSCHHLLLDGWSCVVLLNDLARIYSSKQKGTELPLFTRSTQADYLEWLSGQDESAGRAFWTQQLAHYNEPVSFSAQFGHVAQLANTDPGNHLTRVVHSDTRLDAQIKDIVAELKVTQAAIVYTAWALYLAAIADQDDVVFGTTSAGRSFDLPDNQVMTGYFANVIARRFSLKRSQTLADCIRQSHRDGFALMNFEHIPLEDVRDYIGLAQNDELFDHLVLFENLPLGGIVLQESDGTNSSEACVSMSEFSGDLTSMYPLTLTIRPGAKWRFKFIYADHLQDNKLHSVLDGFPKFLSRVCSNINTTVAQSLEALADNPVIDQITHAVAPELYSLPKTPKQLARNKTELAVAEIWEELLGTTSIDINDEFIALGGRSIAAVKMIARIEDRLGAKLTMLDIVSHPTIAGIASRIDGATEQSNWQSLIPLKPSGSKNPVIFIHAVGSHALFLRSITPYFDEDQPVIGLQLVGLDGECKPMNSIPQIAKHYLQEIQSYQPEGPYYFVAHCLGTIVTHEIIQQLKAQGQEVALFVAIDAHAPLAKLRDSNSEKLKTALKASSDGKRLEGTLELAKRIAAYTRYRAKLILKKSFEHCQLKFGSTLSRKQVYLTWAHEEAHAGMYKYLGTPIDQKVVLIRGNDREFDPYHMHWEEMSAELDIITMPIGHETMFTEPEVSILGTRLQQLVKQS